MLSGIPQEFSVIILPWRNSSRSFCKIISLAISSETVFRNFSDIFSRLPSQFLPGWNFKKRFYQVLSMKFLDNFYINESKSFNGIPSSIFPSIELCFFSKTFQSLIEGSLEAQISLNHSLKNKLEKHLKLIFSFFYSS